MIIYVSGSVGSKKNGGSSTSGFEFLQFLRIKYKNVILITTDDIDLDSLSFDKFYGHQLNRVKQVIKLKKPNKLLDFSVRSFLRIIYYFISDFFSKRKVDLTEFFESDSVENIIYVNSWDGLFDPSILLNSTKFKTVCIVRGSPESFIWQSHDSDKTKAIRDAASFLELFDKLIFVSDNGRKDWGKVLSKNIESYYLPNSINETEIDKVKEMSESDVKSRLKLDKTDYNVIVVGSVQKRKAQDILLEIAPEVIKAIPNIKFHIVGIISNTWGGDIIHKNIIASEYKDYFVFHGHSDEALLFMYAGDLMLFTSHAEAFPRTVAEYMAIGKPILAANVSGVGEMIIHDFNGYLYDPLKPLELANLMKKLVYDKEKQKVFAKNALDSYNNRFSKQIHIKKALEVFENI